MACPRRKAPLNPMNLSSSWTCHLLGQSTLAYYHNWVKLLHLHSGQPEDVSVLSGCVQSFQELYGLQCCHRGLFYAHTISLIGQTLVQQFNSNTSNTAATPATLQQHQQHCSNTCNMHCMQGRGGGGLMKGQVISSCSSGHIADQIDSPLQKEFSFSMLSLSL